MYVQRIVKAFLKTNGYDGLYEPGECACLIGDLMPCSSESALHCLPGYKSEAPEDSEYGFMVGPRSGDNPGGNECIPSEPLSGEDINARAFYQALIDRAIEAGMEAHRFYIQIEICELKQLYNFAQGYLDYSNELKAVENSWLFYARMWASKWNIMHKPSVLKVTV